MIKRCLIIDNENQSEEIEKLIRDAHNRGVTIECEQFNIGNSAYLEVLEEGRINIEKVVSEFRKKFKGQTFHLVAFDWQLDDEEIDGVELIRQLKYNKILRNTPKIVYSGLMDEILKEMLSTSTQDQAVTKIKALVKNGVLGYYERENRDKEIITFFDTDVETLDLIIEEILYKFPDLKFEQKFINDKFNGKTFEEVAEYIDTEDHLKNKFKKEIIHQVISYLTEKI